MRTTFEEACAVSWPRAEVVREVGLAEALRRCNEKLAETGWTSGELCAEAKRRLKERIALMEQEEERDEEPR
jgi:hypothetical protein